nr:hypothetical protein [Angustibacter aerolatus]
MTSRWATARRPPPSARWPSSTTCSSRLGQEHPGATLDDVDVDAVERRSGDGRPTTCAACATSRPSLRRQGWLQRAAGGGERR